VGIGVILDVVYNHLGPDGNYLAAFASQYFTDRYANEWGQAINFDGPDAGPVREFFAANAAYWIDEFHMDGLRLDATQQMFDASPRHVLIDIAERARAVFCSWPRTSRSTPASSGRRSAVATGWTRCGTTTSITPPAWP
jgi:maltooligosyltrehalose trehalohydrolase